jgi:primosomal protein N'
VAEKRKIDRLATDPNTGNTALHSLSEKQKEAFASVKEQLLVHPVGLLHGITGSGKTQIYVALINEVIQQNKQALYMLPEIALTAQMIRRLKQYFGGSIAIYHSKFNPQLNTVSQQLIAYNQRVGFNEYRCNQCPHVGNMVILVETAELLFLITLTFEE